jgi:deoxyribodipyrimidine photolyase-related protein
MLHINKLKTAKTLRLVLGDQLNPEHAWYSTVDDTVLYLVAELPQELDYVKHHEQKICAFFLAMAHFAEHLAGQGHRVCYLTLDDTSGINNLPGLLDQVSKQYSAKQIEYQQPDEYRLAEQLKHYAANSKRPVQCVDSEHFLLPFDEIDAYFSDGRIGKMESFYRKMRVRFDVLMEGDQPVGGKWNYDAQNRGKLKRNDIAAIPETLCFNNDARAVRERLHRHKVSCFGKGSDTIGWPVTTKQAEALLTYFCSHCLPRFGQFQDAMTHQADDRWGLYHARLSFALNAKLIHPMRVIDQAVAAYEKSHRRGESELIDIAQVEGFVRQVLGWREFVRGVYWARMPHFGQENALGATRDLPDYFWTGNTKMACVRHALEQSLDNAYAHHIQRLMVTGNFCLVTGIHPNQVDAWYLGVYVDAIEWVEMPNTRGMSQFADGGVVATKPYAAGGNYINKMSDYCAGCHYNQKARTGDDACPFNAWYWHFMVQHRKRLEKNPRIGMAYRSWDKMSGDDRQALLTQATHNLGRLEQL